MATQSTYLDNAAAAVAGALANTADADIVSRTVETAAGIAFGSPVAQGTDDKGCVFFTTGTVLGVAILDRSATGLNPSTLVAATDTFGKYESARILRNGDVWLVATTGCSAGDPIYVRPSNGTWQDSSANSGVLVAGRWETSADAGGLAVAHIAIG